MLLHFLPALLYYKIVKKNLLVFLILFFVAIVIGVLIWYFVFYQKSSTDTSGAATPTPAAGFGNLSPYASLCVEFQNVSYKVSCEKAVELALAQANGKAQKVSVGPVRTSFPSSSGSFEIRTVDMWLVDVELTSPYFDKTFEKEIHTLRIGFRLDDPNGIYKKPLE